MKYLIVNKFLYPNGGSETYIFGLGKCLEAMGHEVQYFGMDHEGNVVGNRVGAYTPNMDFHGGGLSKLTYPLKTIKSREAAVQIRRVLDDMDPDVVHLNNFNFQITPSVIVETRKWEKTCGNPVKIIFTAHDYQLICPNHMMRDVHTGAVCEKCIRTSSSAKADFKQCTKNSCIHGSKAKSAIGTMEAVYWNNKKHVYNELDLVVCPSEFMKSKMDTNPVFAGKSVTMHNFLDVGNMGKADHSTNVYGDYVLYFGRYSKEKGIGTLLEVCRRLPEVKFVFAGTGPLKDEVSGLPNVIEVGFKSGDELVSLIANARFSIYPSEWYENCPYSVIESQVYGTPVIGADIGGIPELIKCGSNDASQTEATGMLYKAADADALAEAVGRLWDDRALCDKYTENCANVKFDTVEEYTEKLLEIIKGC